VVTSISTLLLVIVAVCSIYAALAAMAIAAADFITKLVERRRERRQVEAKLIEAEMQRALITLASQLGAEAHEARKALIRESFLASRLGGTESGGLKR
jgi:ABC-type methionine transport system permease subunit